MLAILDNINFCLSLQHFEVETKDLANLAWSPDGRVIAVWDSLLDVSDTIYCVNCSTNKCSTKGPRHNAVKFTIFYKNTIILDIGFQEKKNDY